MASPPVTEKPPGDSNWSAARWEELEGEGRANLLRLIGVTTFYAVELANYYGVRLGFFEMPSIVDRTFHIAVTLLTLAWAMLCLSILYCRKQRIVPASLKFISTGCDLVLLTSLLTLSNGPRSPLVLAYLLIIVLAALRFNVRLIWFATAGAVACYLFLLGFARWGTIPGWPKSDMIIPRYHQVIFLMGLVLTGVIVGQVVRRARHLVENAPSEEGEKS